MNSFNEDLMHLKMYKAEIDQKSPRRFASDYAAIDFDELYTAYERLAAKHGDDKQFMIEAAKIDPQLIREASDSVKKDPEFIKALLELYPDQNLSNFGIDAAIIEEIKNSVTESQDAPQEVAEQEQQPIEVAPEQVTQTSEKHGMHGTRYQQQTIMADAIANMHQYVKDHPDEFLEEPSKRGINKIEPAAPAEQTVEEQEEVIEMPQTKEEIDEVMQAYSNSGYGQNANGEYFDPSKDEYDPDYDPHNDPLFNVKIDETQGLGGKDHNQLYSEYAVICNQMAEILGVEPYAGIENANLFEIMFQLDDNDRDKFNELKDKMRVINELDDTVQKEYEKDITFINSARQQMGAMLNMNPYPGIERENFNDINFQLDDSEKDRFFELQSQLEQLKKQHPELFKNTQITKGVAPVSQTQQEESKEETQTENKGVATPVDDNPQHQANPETGYAVGGFQAPAIVVGGAAAIDGTQGDSDGASSDDSSDTSQEADEELDDNLDNEQDLDDLDDLEQDQMDPEGFTDEEMQIMVKQQKRKEFCKKALAAAAGFVTGVGLSCVPGVGQIRMAMAATKLVAAGVNFWSKRHPDGKIAKMRNFVVNQWYDKCPNFARGVDKIRAKLKTVPYNAFINGMSAGYITGNVFEMLTGNTVLEAIGEKMHPTPTVSEIPQTTPTDPHIETGEVQQIQGPVEPTPTPTPPPPTPDPVPTGPTAEQLTDAIKHGEHIDISGIEMGRVSSDAQNAVKLLQSAGKDVTFLREVTLPDGTVMWAFNQSNGAGYAWFKADEILDYLGQTAPEVASSMHM